MADEQDRHPAFVPQLAQQLEHLGLHGDIERAGRLVGQQHLGPQGQGERDRHPLQLPAGQLGGVAAQQAGVEQDAAHGRVGPFVRLGGREAVQPQRPVHDPAHPVHRVEGQRRALEDGRDPPPADGPQPGPGQLGQLLAVQPDRAGDRGPGGPGQPEHGQDRHRLAGAALPGQADDLAGVHGQLAHRRDRAPGEAHLEVTDLQLHRTITCRGSRTSRSPSPSRLNASAMSRMARPG